jgi:hypothetical protein
MFLTKFTGFVGKSVIPVSVPRRSLTPNVYILIMITRCTHPVGSKRVYVIRFPRIIKRISILKPTLYTTDEYKFLICGYFFVAISIWFEIIVSKANL